MSDLAPVAVKSNGQALVDPRILQEQIETLEESQEPSPEEAESVAQQDATCVAVEAPPIQSAAKEIKPNPVTPEATAQTAPSLAPLTAIVPFKPFKEAVGMVNRAAGNHSAMPIIGGIKVTVNPNQITLAATDLEFHLSYTLAAETEGQDSFVVNGAQLQKLLSKIKKAELVTLTLSDLHERAIIEINGGKSELLLMALEDYPELPKPSIFHRSAVQDLLDKAKQSLAPYNAPRIQYLESRLHDEDGWPSVMVKRSQFIQALEQTTFAAMSAKETSQTTFAACGSRETSRLKLIGVDIVFAAGMILFAATNRYRLAYSEIVQPCTSQDEIILPAASLEDLTKCLSKIKSEDHVSLYYGSGASVGFDCGPLSGSIRIVQEHYPNFGRVIPKDNKIALVLNRQAYLDALEAVNPFAPTESRAVLHKVENQALTLSASSIEKGQAERAVALASPCEPVTIRFRGEYIIDALKATDAQTVTLWLADEESAGLLEPGEIENGVPFLYVCMPIRMES